VKIGGPKLYLSSKVIVFRMTKLTIREWKQGQDRIVIIEGELYKHGVCSPLLKCLSRAEGIELMKEIHAGLCGSHIGSRPLLGKVFRQGFYWPKAASDATELVQKCENCQKCARDQKQPSSLTQLIQPT
jgi:hypothetical protein